MLKTKSLLTNSSRSSRRLQEQYIRKKPLSTRVATVLGKLRSPEMVRLSNQILLFGRNDIRSAGRTRLLLASFLDPVPLERLMNFRGLMGAVLFIIGLVMGLAG